MTPSPIVSRRGIIIGAAAFFAASPGASARGMYCTRHRAACRRRREFLAREGAREEAIEKERRSRLSPEQLAAEDRLRAERRAEAAAKRLADAKAKAVAEEGRVRRVWTAVSAAVALSIVCGFAFWRTLR